MKQKKIITSEDILLGISKDGENAECIRHINEKIKEIETEIEHLNIQQITHPEDEFIKSELIQNSRLLIMFDSIKNKYKLTNDQ